MFRFILTDLCWYNRLFIYLFNSLFLFLKNKADESTTSNRIDFEDYMLNYCQSLIMKQWRSSSVINPITLSWRKNESIKGMSLLHLAARLGYTRLVNTFMTWQSENPNIILDMEINALSQDNEGFTPLVCV